MAVAGGVGPELQVEARGRRPPIGPARPQGTPLARAVAWSSNCLCNGEALIERRRGIQEHIPATVIDLVER
jgi:hypothetical protein